VGYYRVDFRCDDDDPLQRELDRLYGYHDDIETRVLHRGRLNLFFLLLRELIAKRVVTRMGSALDIGCNAGMYSKILSDEGFAHVEGIDIDEEQVRRAVETFAVQAAERSIEFRVENAEAIDPARKYDFILCTEVIEHTSQPQKVIENIAAALVPGGIAVVTLPNAFSLPFAKAALKYRLTRKARDPVFEDHLRYPFWRAMRLFEGVGLERVRTTGTNLIWDATTLRWLYRTPVFEPLNRAQFALARRWPLEYGAQFFYSVWQKEPKPRHS
jgi:SAM-dependent methyltransferase